MANEFIIKNGFISKGDGVINGGLNISNIGGGTPQINLGLDSSGNVVTGTTGGGTFTGNTSGDCITDLYVTNLYGCSPITVNDSIQSVTSSATGTTSFAFGFQTKAHGDYSTASGYQTSATTIGSTASGYKTLASGVLSHAEGFGTTASGYYSHAEGQTTIASGSGSHAEGQGTIASGKNSHAEGLNTTASGYQSHAQGVSTIASGDNSHAEGYGNIASGDASHAEGGILFSGKGLVLQPTSATTYSSHAEGRQTLASGQGSHAEGAFTVAGGQDSHAEGNATTASNSGSHAEGQLTIASGIYSHAEGRSTIASGNYSHTEGYFTTASGFGSHAEGRETVANTLYTHAEGYQSTASGYASHAEGQQTIASGSRSHAEGIQTTASGNYSHAQGFQSTTSSNYSHVGGRQNSVEAHENNNIYGGKFQTISASTSSNGCNTVSGGYNNQIVGGFGSVAMGIGGYITGSINYHFGQGSITDGTINSGANQVVFGGGAATIGPAGKTNTILFDTFAGNGYWDGAADLGPADYAEYFEWNDGNTLDEDRVGYFVSLVSNTEKIEMSNNNVIGIVSAKPAIVGDSSFFGWKNRYVKDEWGRDLSDEYDMYQIIMSGNTDNVTIYISENDTVYSEYPNLGNPQGVLYEGSTDDKIFIEKTMVKRINPSYDPTQQYISRKNRPEWSAIGLLGKLRVKTAEQITGPSVSVNSNGMAVNGSDYPVLETIKAFDGNYGIIKVLFK